MSTFIDDPEFLARLEAEQTQLREETGKLIDPETLSRTVEAHIQDVIFAVWVRCSPPSATGHYPTYVQEEIASRYPDFLEAWNDFHRHLKTSGTNVESTSDQGMTFPEVLLYYCASRFPASKEPWWYAVLHDTARDPRVQRMHKRINDLTKPAVQHRYFERWKQEVTGASDMEVNTPFQTIDDSWIGKFSDKLLEASGGIIEKLLNALEEKKAKESEGRQKGKGIEREFPPKIDDWSKVLIVLSKWEEHPLGMANIHVSPNEKGKMTFEQLGFQDRRTPEHKPPVPNLCWRLLEDFANANGILAAEYFASISESYTPAGRQMGRKPSVSSEDYTGDPADFYVKDVTTSSNRTRAQDSGYQIKGKLPDNLRTRMSELRSRLKDLFKTKEDPIAYCELEDIKASPKGYETKFRITTR